MVRVWVVGLILACMLVGCGGPADDGAAVPTTASTEPLTAAPVVTGFTPAKAVQGATVTITGKGFTTSASVAFDGIASTAMTFVSATKLRAVVPEGATSGPITVATAAGSGSSATTFSVLPQIVSLSATAGIAGNTVEVVGSGFTGATAVTLGTVPVAFTFEDDEHLTVVIPDSATTGRIFVTTPAGSDSSPTAFTIEKAPKIASFTPASSGLPATLTITGSYFIGTTDVRIGVVTLPTFTVVSNKQITATVPLGTPSGTVTVVNMAGSSVSKAAFVAIPCADADADTVCDSTDKCPGSDDRIDTDGDGIPDGCDVCPMDNPDDSDGDTVCNSVDKCPGSDDRIDTDGDGIPDGCDVCPADNTNDSDADTVCDSADKCPGSDDRIDTDGDGIPDGCDVCPGPANDGQSCGAGKTCSAAGACVTLHCDSTTTGSGVVQGDVNVDDTDTNGDLQRLAGAWCVTGNVYVTGTSLRDLSAFQNLAEVAGSLMIGETLPNCTFPCTSGNTSLTSLHGLESLRRVGGDLHIYEGYSTTQGIASLVPLSSLADVGNLIIDSTNLLTDLQGLENVHSVQNLYIVYNRSLKSLSGLEGIRSAAAVDVYDDEQLTDTSALRNLSTVPGMFRVYQTAVTSLAGVEGLRSVGDFFVINNPQLVDLDAFSELTSVSGELSVSNSPLVTSLSAFAHLTRVNVLQIGGLGVTSLQGLENLTGVGSQLGIAGNPYLVDLSALSHVTEPVAYVGISQNASLQTLADLNGLTGIQTLDIEQNASLVSCANVAPVEGSYVIIVQNPMLTSLSCLSNVHALQGLRLMDDDSVTTLDDLTSLKSIYDLMLTGNDGLVSLQGIRGVTTLMPGGLDIESNSRLTDLRGLEGVTQLNYLYLMQNNALTSLAGLDGLRSVQAWGGIENNASLPECAVAALSQQLGRPMDADFGNTGTGDCSQ